MRRAEGLTQTQMAERLGVSEQYLRRIEAGKANLSLKSLARVAAAYGQDAGVLFRAPGGPGVG